MKNLLRSSALLTAFLSLNSFAEPNYKADSQYSPCIAKAKGDQRDIQECKNNVIERRRLEAYYKKSEIPGYSEYYDKFEDDYEFIWQPKWHDLRKPSIIANIKMDKYPGGHTLYLVHVGIFTDEDITEDLCKETYWLIDGKRLELDDYITYHKDGVHLSTSDLTEDQFRQIAYADKVEFKYCDVEGELSKNDQKGMQYALKRYLDEKDVTFPVGDTFNKKRN